jgi:hypothetical protein
LNQPTGLDSVRETLQRRKKEILETYRATGVGIGQEGESYRIVVYLQTPDDLPEKPTSVDGVQLKFVVTGPLQLLRAKER